ncbi:hypothetical protein B0H19DRAFT_293399 [Mycena capillaripes]|nr:hypothetical protein B0H19DRAFT_293399 [Mycena capillaripes]
MSFHAHDPRPCTPQFSLHTYIHITASAHIINLEHSTHPHSVFLLHARALAFAFPSTYCIYRYLNTLHYTLFAILSLLYPSFMIRFSHFVFLLGTIRYLLLSDFSERSRLAWITYFPDSYSVSVALCFGLGSCSFLDCVLRWPARVNQSGSCRRLVSTDVDVWQAMF